MINQMIITALLLQKTEQHQAAKRFILRDKILSVSAFVVKFVYWLVLYRSNILNQGRTQK